MSSIRIPSWAEKVADSLGDGPHMIVSGITPSGHIHAGNLREVMVSEAVANALKARGHEARFVFIADTIDPLRKIAPGIPEDYKSYIGRSISRVPDPEGCHESYAEHFLASFEAALREMEMDVEILRSHELYEKGVYTEVTREAIEHTEELRDILQEVSGREMPEGWSPYVPRAASGDLTGNRFVEHRSEEHAVVFVDRDGNKGIADYSKDEGKLGWRVELAARWKALGVTFEPFGKDHTSSGGSTETADRMAREVFHYPVPGRFEYEWIQLKGVGAMSSSKGIVLLPKDLPKIMPPDAVRRLILGRDPARALDLDLTGGFPAFMDEYRDRSRNSLVPFSHLVTIAQTVEGNVNAASRVLEAGGYRQDTVDLSELAKNLEYAQAWARDWAPESYKIKLLTLSDARKAAEALDETQLKYLDEAGYRLNSLAGTEFARDGDRIQDLLYSTTLEFDLRPRKAFAAIYTVLIGKKSGPKAGPFIAQIGPYIAVRHFVSTYRNDIFQEGAEL
ncbi:MAG: lysine--tRNA ligase [Rubrobacteraceae bacterium]